MLLNFTMKFASPSILALCAQVLVVGSSTSWGNLATYELDSSGSAYSSLGNGTFTLDIGNPLGAYSATGVSGGGSTFGTWDAVAFRVNPGVFPSLVISNFVGASLTFSIPGIGGEVATGSQADLEWANFISSFSSGFGVSIRALPTSNVPDQGPWLPITAAALGVTVLFTQRGRGFRGMSRS